MAIFSYILSLFQRKMWSFCSYLVQLLPCVAHACKIVLCSVPNLSNYGHCFVNLVCLLCYLREEWVDFIHIWYSNQVHVLCVTNACKRALGSMPNSSNCGICYKFYVFVALSSKRELILFMFGTAINHNKDLMHVKYTLSLCQNVTFMSI